MAHLPHLPYLTLPSRQEVHFHRGLPEDEEENLSTRIPKLRESKSAKQTSKHVTSFKMNRPQKLLI